jgi:hypothetical protein
MEPLAGTYWEWVRANFSVAQGVDGHAVQMLDDHLARALLLGVEPLSVPWTRVIDQPTASYAGNDFTRIPHGTMGDIHVVELGMALAMRHPARVPHADVTQLLHSLAALAVANRDACIQNWEPYYWLSTLVRCVCVAIDRLDLLVEFNADASDEDGPYSRGPAFDMHGVGLAAAACYPRPRDPGEIDDYLYVVDTADYDAIIDTRLVEEVYPEELDAHLQQRAGPAPPARPFDWPSHRDLVLRQVARGDVWCNIPCMFDEPWWATDRGFPCALEIVEAGWTPLGLSPISEQLAVSMPTAGADGALRYREEWGGAGGLLARLGRALIALASGPPPVHSAHADRFGASLALAELWHIAITAAATPGFVRARALLAELAPLATALQARYVAGDFRTLYANDYVDVYGEAQAFFLNSQLPASPKACWHLWTIRQLSSIND